MFRFCVIALLAVSAMGLPSRVARPRLTDKRIVGGENADKGEFPSQISLQWFGSHMCGGSLIAANAVLTAGHCCDGESASSLSIVAGGHNLDGNEPDKETRDVAEIRLHEDYDSSTIENDICILILDGEIAEADAIQYGVLAEAGREPADLELLTVTGWGTTSEGGNLAEILQKVDVPYVPNDRCSEAYAQFGGVADGMLCAGFEEEGGADACQGDSGGPIFFKDGAQVGLTSWGLGCARPGYPGVYTRIPSYVDWVAANLS